MVDERRIDIPRQIGQEVRARRTELGLTQQQLAELAGVSRKFVLRLEQGRAEAVFLRKLLDVLHALGLSLFVRSDDWANTQARKDGVHANSKAAEAYLEGIRTDSERILEERDADGL